MNVRERVSDRVKRSLQPMDRGSFGAHLKELLTPGTEEELERRRAHLVALVLVAIVSSATHVIGPTAGNAQYTAYGLAIAVAALVGGTAPGMVATMAAVLLAGVESPASAALGRVLFTCEGLALSVVVGRAALKLRQASSRLETVERANQMLSGEAARARLERAAFEHLEQTAADSAVFIINRHGLIVDWPASARRMYEFTAEQMLGSNASTL